MVHRPLLALAILVAAGCSHGDGVSAPGVGAASPFGPQFQSEPDRESWTLESLISAQAAAVADIDGDGAADVLVGGYRLAMLAWGPLDVGHTATTALPVDYGSHAVAVVDLDGDGDLDLAVAQGYQQPLCVWLQVAPRLFERHAIDPLPPGVITGLAVADFDGDGHQDLAAAHSNGSLLLLGDGHGGLRDASSRLPPSMGSERVAAGHLLGGPLPDLVFLAWNGGVVVLRNDGTGFVDVTAGAVGSVGGATPTDVAVADLDGDGHGDLLLRAREELVWFPGLGGGRLAAAVRAPAPGHGRMQLVDDDGRLELAAGTDTGVSVWRFDPATRSFAAVAGVPGLGGFADVVAAGDLDGDGGVDLLAALPPLRVLWRQPTGYYVDALPRSLTSQLPLDGPSYILGADFDGDGDIDLAATLRPPGGSQYLRNDGSAVFTSLPGVNEAWSALAALDLDRDGVVDMIGQGEWRRSGGDGTFGPAQPFAGAVVGRPAIGDFDGDGADEALVLAVLPNLGVLRLRPASPVPTIDAPPGLEVGVDATELVAGDFDGDGIDDVVVVHAGSQTQLFSGTRSGGFVDRTLRLPRDLDPTQAVAAGDWDGDGTLDLIVARKLATMPQLYGRVYLNHVGGEFSIGPLFVSDQSAPLSMFDVFASDVDEDGRAEVFFDVRIAGSYHLPFPRLEMFVRAPTGTAQHLTAAAAGIDNMSTADGRLPLQFFDVDGDGDLDVLGPQLRRNGQRDLTFWTRPHWGRRCELRVTDRGCRPGEWATVLISLAPARVRLPGIGLLLVDADLAVRVPVDLAAAGGRAIVGVDLPAAALGITRLYAQALLFDGAGALRAITPRSEANAR